MKFRTIMDGGGEVREVSAADAQNAAEEALEKAFNRAENMRGGVVYVEDRDGELLAFDVTVRMEPVFDAAPSDDEIPTDIQTAFGRGR